jgi:hypothetical protein
LAAYFIVDLLPILFPLKKRKKPAQNPELAFLVKPPAADYFDLSIVAIKATDISGLKLTASSADKSRCRWWTAA